MSLKIGRNILWMMAFVAMSGCSDALSENDGSGRPEELPMTKVINTPDGAADGCILVSTDAVDDLDSFGKELSEQLGTVNVSRVFPADIINDDVAVKYGLHRWVRVDFSDVALTRAAEVLSGMPQVKMVQYNKNLRPASDCSFSPYIPTMKQFASEALPFNDEMLSDQWHYINRGTSDICSGAVEGADIAVKDAWKLTAGNRNVVVAIIDGPVKYNHPDLAANMWKNEKEIAGNGIDDDDNGYVDDIHGWNCSASYLDSKSDLYVGGDISWNHPEETGHGTHVAGTVAAVNGNGIGVCGVAGGTGNDDGVRLMSCQIFQGGVSGSIDASARAFYYAARNGASIAQCSFGYEGGHYKSDSEYKNINSLGMDLEYAAIQYFMDPANNNSDILDGNIVIAAAGNEAYPQSSYPAALENVVSVTGIGPDFLPAVSYTNYGLGCNIAAPGGDYFIGNTSDIRQNKSRVLSTFINTVTDENLGAAGYDYVYMQGTSMACPHVSGVAALGLSYAYDLGRTFTRDEFISMLLTSVNDLDASLIDNQTKPSGLSSTADLGQYRYKMGTGALDAWKFLMSIEGTPSLMVKNGVSARYDISSFFGESASNLTYLSVDCGMDTWEALGLAADPEIKYGKLSIKPTKVGSGKIVVKAIAGYDEDGIVDGEVQTGGMEITRTISVMSRGVVSDNGGWL